MCVCECVCVRARRWRQGACCRGDGWIGAGLLAAGTPPYSGMPCTGHRCRPVDSAPPCMQTHTCCSSLHRRPRAHVRWCVCVLARARQSLTNKKSPPARTDHAMICPQPQRADLTCRLQVASATSELHIGPCEACAHAAGSDGDYPLSPLAYAYSRSSSLQIAHADDALRVLSRHSAVWACKRARALVRVRTELVVVLTNS